MKSSIRVDRQCAAAAMAVVAVRGSLIASPALAMTYTAIDLTPSGFSFSVAYGAVNGTLRRIPDLAAMCQA